MRVVVPFTEVSPGTATALAGQAVEFVDVSADDQAYWRLLASLWRTAEDFTIVEQDIVVQPDTLDRFDACNAHWCAATYPYLDTDTYAGLGCVRFRSSLMERYPDVMDAAGEYTDEQHPKRFWCSLDAAMQFALWGRGERVCTHGPVGHLHHAPSHGCVPGYA